MGDTVLEIENALKSIGSFLPFVATGVSFFAPQYAPLVSALSPAFQALADALGIVHQDTGKPLDQVVTDVVNHLTPGAPPAPSLT
jgi:hypothetical protein